MRKLYYVPVIHISAEMGSMAPVMDQKSADICGREQWEKHKRYVTAYWDGLEHFFKGMDARHLKIYQDGLLAGGELGLRIVREGARRKSRNHEIVLDLVEKGAELCKTEDTNLLAQEYNHLLKMAQEGSAWERALASMTDEWDRDGLLEKRDRFITKTIHQTLQQGERGVLFLGAFHDAISKLASDIDVKAVKDPQKVAAYFRCLMSGGDEEAFEQLGNYLTREIEI